MSYSAVTKDGILIPDIPDDMPPDSPQLKARVDAIRASKGDSGGALPSSVAAQDQKLRAEGGGGIGAFAGDVGRSAMDFWRYGTPLSEGGREGLKDAAGNVYEGTKQLFGGDRSGVVAERERQAKQAADLPGYRQSKEFWNIAGNPLSYIPATNVLKAAATGAGIMGLQPAESPTEQAWNAVKGATIGGGLRTIAKAIPSGAAEAATPAAEEAGGLTLRDASNLLKLIPGASASTLGTVLRVAHSGRGLAHRLANWNAIEGASPETQAILDALRRAPGQSTGAFEEMNQQPGPSRYSYQGP
jgi:hypothetical protein